MKFLLATCIGSLLSVAIGSCFDLQRVVQEGMWAFQFLFVCTVLCATMQGWLPASRVKLQWVVGFVISVSFFAALWFPPIQDAAHIAAVLSLAVAGATAVIRLWVAGRNGLQN